MKTIKFIKFIIVLAFISINASLECFAVDEILYEFRTSDSTYYVTYKAYQNPNKGYRLDSLVVIADSVKYYNGRKYPVTRIGSYAFMYARNLHSIHLPNTIKNIGDYAFSNTDLSHIHFGDSLESIGDHAFYGLKYTELRFPASLKYIYANAFGIHSYLTDVYCYGTTPPSLGYYVFITNGNINNMPTELHNINLHVPYGYENAYRNAGHWGYFNIIGDINAPTTDLENTKSSDDKKIILDNGQIVIKNKDRIYNLQGQRIK